MSQTTLRPAPAELSEIGQSPITVSLKQVLADGSDLFSHTQQAHWHIQERGAAEAHALLDQLSALVDGHLRGIVVRAFLLAPGDCRPIRPVYTASRLPEYPAYARTFREHLDHLADHYRQFAGYVRLATNEATDAGDQSTAGLLSEMLHDIEKALRIIRSRLANAALTSGGDHAHRQQPDRKHGNTAPGRASHVVGP